MHHVSEPILLRRAPLPIVISLLLAGAINVASAADIVITPPPGGNFVVKNPSGAATVFKVDGAGPVTVTNLGGAPTYSSGVCFGPGGVLGQCASIAGPAGAIGPIGAIGPAGATGATGATGAAGEIGPTGAGGGLLHFSTGTILSGASVVSAAPILIGFGNSTVEVIDGMGESTMPPEAGGFSIPIPSAGTLQNLQISADLLVASVTSINTVGLQYDFSVFVAQSVPNNGIDHLSPNYVTTPLTGTLRFGFPYTVITAGTFRSATNLSLGSLLVAPGDRVGIRVRTNASTDASAADVTQLSFSASLSFLPAP